MNQKTGVKESAGKVAYDLDWEFIEAMALRMDENRHKYAVGNWKRPIPKADLLAALARHHTQVQRHYFSDNGDQLSSPNFGHLIAIACNAMMLYYQAKNYVQRPTKEGGIEFISPDQMKKELGEAIGNSLIIAIQKELENPTRDIPKEIKPTSYQQKDYIREITPGIGVIDPRKSGDLKFDPDFYDLQLAREEEARLKELESQYLDFMKLPFKVNIYEEDTKFNNHTYDNTESTELPIKRSTEPVSRNRGVSELLEGPEEKMHRGFLEQREMDAGETLFLRKLRNYQAEQNRLLESEGDGSSHFTGFRMGTLL